MILLFDSIGEPKDPSRRGSVFRPVFDEVLPFSAGGTPRVLTHPIYPQLYPRRASFNQSTRTAILSQLMQRKFIEEILQDNALLLCAVINCMAGAWLEVIGETEDCIQPSSQDITEFVHDNIFLEVLMDFFAEIHENITMLTKSLALLKSRGCSTLRCKDGSVASRLMMNLTIDFQELLRRAQQHKSQVQQRIVTIAAVRSITESGRAIEQSDAIG